MHLHSLEMPAIAFRIPSSALQSHWDVLWNIDNHWRPWQRAMGKKIPSASPSCVMAMIGTNGTRQAEVTVDVAGIRYFSRCSLFFSLLGCVLCVCSQISFVRRFGICSLSNERIRMPVFLDVHDLFFFCFLRERIYNSRIFSAAIVTVLLSVSLPMTLRYTIHGACEIYPMPFLSRQFTSAIGPKITLPWRQSSRSRVLLATADENNVFVNECNDDRNNNSGIEWMMFRSHRFDCHKSNSNFRFCPEPRANAVDI